VPTLLVGTRKGLFLASSADNRRNWEVSGPLLKGWEVFHAVPDPRDGSVYAATNSFVYGATVHRSDDRGETWTRAEELGLPEETGLTLEKTWHVRPGREGEDGRVWLGGAPGVLFRSDDSGRTWETVKSLVGHGVGRHYHEDPHVPNFGDAGRGPRLSEGMTIAIEPMITMGRPEVWLAEDGWTIATSDGSLAAHFEHTVAILPDGPRILTPRVGVPDLSRTGTA